MTDSRHDSDPTADRSTGDSSDSATQGPRGFESLRREAKQWLKALRRGEASALERLERVLARHSSPPVLREVQQALAREQGFVSWAELKEHHALEASGDGSADAALDLFLEHACIFTAPTDLPVKWRRADRLLARRPGIARSGIHAAAVCGEVERARSLLDADPAAISHRGGPQQWEPLLFACYGRLSDERARENGAAMVELLLDAGADPNAFFESPDDWRLRFSALTGAMGQGEMGQPEHPQARAVARMLLDRGADPNDGQGLYNTHLVGDDTSWLELLSEYGLGPRDPVRWHVHPEDAAKSGADRCPAIFDYLVSGAVRNGHVRRLAWLLEHGANPEAVSIYDGKTCAEGALLNSDAESYALLLRHGARAVELEGHDGFVAAVRSGDRNDARRRVESHPDYCQRVEPLLDAAQRGDLATVRLLLELGVDPNLEGPHGHRALNNACRYREIAGLLVEYGADPRARAFGGTACGWARHAGDMQMARFHAAQSRSLLDAAMSGHVGLVRELLESDATAIDERDPDGNGPLHELCPDPAEAEPIIAMLLAKGADPEQRNDAGQTPAEHLEAMGSDDVGDLLEVMQSAR